MSLLSKIFSKKEENKSFNPLASQISSYYNMQTDSNSVDLQNDNSAIWNSNPQRFYKNTLAILLEKVSSTISNIEYTLENEDGDPVKDIMYQDIINKIEKPSLRQQTKKQLIEDLAIEYLANRLMFLVYKETDESLYCIKSYEILVENQYFDDKIFKSYRLKISPTKQIVLTFLPDKLYYYNSAEKIRLYPSELVFEELSKYNLNYFNLVYLKHIFNDIFDFVYLEEMITLKNLAICKTKQDANLINIYPTGNQILTNPEAIKQAIQQATSNAQKNGSTQVIATSVPVEAKLLQLNDNNFNMQFIEQYKEIAQKGLFSYFQVPVQFGLEQAKFTNNITGSLDYLENAIMPKCDFIYNFLTNTIQDIFNNPNVFIKPNYNKTSIKQQYDSERSLKLVNIATINELRQMNGLEPIPEGDVLLKNSQTNQLQEDNQNLIKNISS